jgi:hypothetical protein
MGNERIGYNRGKLRREPAEVNLTLPLSIKLVV